MTEGRGPFLGAGDGPRPRTGAEELAAGSGPSAVGDGKAVVDFVGGEKAVAASRAVIELGGESVALPLGEQGQIGAFGEVLAQETVGVFVGPSLPGVVGQGEVDGGAQAPLQRLVHMKLRAVIRGQGANRVPLVAQNRDGALQRFLGPDPGDLADPDQATLAFDHGDGGGFAPAVHGVDLPVTQPRALLDHGGAFRDHPFAREPAAAVVAGVALALQFARTAQMPPERASARFVGPDVQVDRLVAHGPDSFHAQAADNLLGTEVLAEHALDRGEVGRPIAPVVPGAPPAAAGLLHGPARAVRSIIPRPVAPDLAPNGGAVSLQLPRHLPDASAANSQRANHVSFLRAQLLVDHPPEMSHLLPESKEPNQSPEPTAPSGRGSS